MNLQLSDRDLIKRIEELTNNEFTVRMNYDITEYELKYMFWKRGETVFYDDKPAYYIKDELKYTIKMDLNNSLARDPYHIANEVLKLENEEMRAQESFSDPSKPTEYVPIKCKVCGAPMTHGQFKCIYCGQEYMKVERN